MSKRLTRALYRAARRLNDIETLLTGSPKRILRRAKNKLVHRRLGRLWRLLWR